MTELLEQSSATPAGVGAPRGRPTEQAAVLWVLLWSAGLVAVFAPLTMRAYNAER